MRELFFHSGRILFSILILFLSISLLWADEPVRNINTGTLSNPRSEICDINTLGQAAGWAYTDEEVVHAFLWERGEIADLGTLGGLESRASGINKYGQVVGWSETANGEVHAFLWENGVMEDLGTLGGSRSEAMRITENGQVVGRSETTTGEVHSFIWEKGEMFDLNIPGGKASETHDVPGAGKEAGIGGRGFKEKKSSGSGRGVRSQDKGNLPDRGIAKEDIFITPNIGNLYNGLAGFVGGALPDQADWIIGNRCPVPLSAPTDAMVFSTNDSGGWEERMRITKSGNVGIGDDNPTEALDVQGSIRATDEVLVGSDITIDGSISSISSNYINTLRVSANYPNNTAGWFIGGDSGFNSTIRAENIQGVAATFHSGDGFPGYSDHALICFGYDEFGGGHFRAMGDADGLLAISEGAGDALYAWAQGTGRAARFRGVVHFDESITLDPIAAPDPPATGFVIYVDGADGDLKAKADTGVVTVLAND